VDHKAFMEILNTEDLNLSKYEELKNSSDSFDSYMMDVTADNDMDSKTGQS